MVWGTILNILGNVVKFTLAGLYVLILLGIAFVILAIWAEDAIRLIWG